MVHPERRAGSVGGTMDNRAMRDARVGILGGGQLAQMMAMAARAMDVGCRFYETSSAAPGATVGEVVTGSFDDRESLRRFAAGMDVVTYEWENVPVDAARLLAETAPVHPSPRALEVAQDRLVEKDFLRDLGAATVAYAAVDGEDDLARAIDAMGTPALLKTRRLGYDGKGQMLIPTPADAGAAWAQLGDSPLILEQYVAVDRELSIIAVRGADGSIGHYPLVESRHEAGILRVSTAPAPNVAPAIVALARTHIDRVLATLDYVGVLAIEMFDMGGTLLVNEMAPRVHNSGHWTIEGAATSQFENHIRAILGLPLGSTDAAGLSCMVNIIGTLPRLEAVLAIPDAHLHLYGKSPRPGRKLGHVTVRAAAADELDRRRDAVIRAVAPELLAATGR